MDSLWNISSLARSVAFVCLAMGVTAILHLASIYFDGTGLGPRVFVLISVYSGPIIIVAILISAWRGLKAFLRDHPSISAEDDLIELRRFAKTDMYRAVCVSAAIAYFGTSATIGVIRGFVHLADLAILAVLAVPIVFIVIKLYQAQLRIRTVFVENESLRPEVEHVIRTWERRMFPDW